MILGIDPGVHGGYCFLDKPDVWPANEGLIGVYKFDSVRGLKEKIETRNKMYPTNPLIAVMEKITALPAKSTKTEAVFFQNIGAIKAVLEILQIPLVEVRPQTWQSIRGKWQLKNMDNKAKSIAAAQEIWPGYKFPQGARGKVYDGPIEAALIAEWYLKKGKLYAQIQNPR